MLGSFGRRRGCYPIRPRLTEPRVVEPVVRANTHSKYRLMVYHTYFSIRSQYRIALCYGKNVGAAETSEVAVTTLLYLHL